MQAGTLEQRVQVEEKYVRRSKRKKIFFANDVYCQYRDKHGLHTPARLLARGVERRFVVASRAPHSSLASREMTPPVRLLKELMVYDQRDAGDALLEITEQNVQAMAIREGWQIKASGGYRAMCEIALMNFLGNPVSQRAAAALCKIGLSTYQRNWHKKIKRIEIIFKSWAAQIILTPLDGGSKTP